MKMKSHADVLRLFEPVGRFSFANIINDPEAEWLTVEVPRDDPRPCVYAWVEHPAEGEPRILYIGKAGSSLHKRHRQHSGGFVRAATGRRHIARIGKLLKGGSQVRVWVHYPEPAIVRGETVAIHSAVEEHLIATLYPKPLLNREGKAVAAAAGLD